MWVWVLYEWQSDRGGEAGKKAANNGGGGSDGNNGGSGSVWDGSGETPVTGQPPK